MKPTHLSLFSGIGGLDLAAEWAGFQTVGQCEWADYPTKILEKHWPDVPRWRDIHTLTKESFFEKTGLRTVDIISGGFPCQPFSNAGKRKGKDDDRYLWPEMLRVIQELQPAWVVGENVPGIVNLALDTVLSDLEGQGYEVQCLLIPACGVDAPHKRERACIVAHSLDRRGIMRRLWESENTESHGSSRADKRGGTQDFITGERRPYEPSASGMADGIRAEIYGVDPNTQSMRLQGLAIRSLLVSEFTKRSCRERERRYRGQLQELVELTPLGKIGQLNPTWVEWLMGYPTGWTELDA